MKLLVGIDFDTSMLKQHQDATLRKITHVLVKTNWGMAIITLSLFIYPQKLVELSLDELSKSLYLAEKLATSFFEMCP